MPFSRDPLLAEMMALHRHGLTEEQWTVLALNAKGYSTKRIAVELDRHPTTIRDIKRRAGDHIFAGTEIESTDGSLGWWFGEHCGCCPEAA